MGILGDTTASLIPRVLPTAVAGFAMLGLAGRLLGADARPGDLATVLRGLPHNVTTEMDLDLWQLATRIRADADAANVIRRTPPAELADRYRTGTLPPVVQRGLEEFLDRYGHRAVAEIDVGLPRWAEDPTHIIGVLANYLRLEDPDRAPDLLFARGAAQAEAMVATLTERARRRGRVRGRAVGFALNRARQLVGVRELPKYYIVLVLAQVRQQLVAVGAQLVATGRLAAAEDVFFLDLGEAAAGLHGQNLRAVVTHRRQTYGRELRRGHIPRVLLSDGTEPEAGRPPMTFTDGGLVGAASAGTVTGQARVVLDPTGAHLQPGEILVAPSTDPGGLRCSSRRRAGHGDGRCQLPRRGRRARVRHPGRRRRAECDKPDYHRTAVDRRRQQRPDRHADNRSKRGLTVFSLQPPFDRLRGGGRQRRRDRPVKRRYQRSYELHPGQGGKDDSGHRAGGEGWFSSSPDSMRS